MKMMRLGRSGEEIPAVRVDETIHDARPVTSDIDGAFLATGGIDRLRTAVTKGSLPVLGASPQIRIGSPIARPTAVICVGQNYVAHAAESGNKPPTAPILFFKHPNTVVGPNDDIINPPGAKKLDWEVELGIVIGRRAGRLTSREEGLMCVAGYVTSHDVSERVYQLEVSGGQWSKGKSAPTFNPVGPWLVPAADVGDVQSLRLWSAVNGELRQDSNTADMIFDVADLILDISQYMTLEPGDLINTGTPQGVALSGRFPYLQPGNVVEMGIEKLGEQRNAVVQADPSTYLPINPSDQTWRHT